jgi:hypothetical protein
MTTPMPSTSECFLCCHEVLSKSIFKWHCSHELCVRCTVTIVDQREPCPVCRRPWNPRLNGALTKMVNRNPSALEEPEPVDIERLPRASAATRAATQRPRPDMPRICGLCHNRNSNEHFLPDGDKRMHVGWSFSPDRGFVGE